MQDIIDTVLSFEKIQNHLKVYPHDEEKIEKIILEIKGDYNTKVLGAMEKFIDSTFRKLYDDFHLQKPEGFSLQETIKKYHVVLVPNHQSHADYMALQYIFFKYFKFPVYIAAGDNMNIFPIGEIFKKCGAFFIRRKFDDDLYKAVFQGYIYYLLKTDKVVEFFFEGGRTRTGKLLPPRYGLFSIILEAHSKFTVKKPLLFIPVSIAHEHIPEEKAHAKELRGSAKEKESTKQLLKLFNLFNKKLGTVHVNLSPGIEVSEFTDLKSKTQELAFECFKKVGKGMPITPTALLSLVLLDDPSGAITWEQIKTRSEQIIEYCLHMNIPLTKSLSRDDYVNSLKLAMDIFLNNKKVSLIKRQKLNTIFYTVIENERVHLLFHKNMILHHFFVPTLINFAWINIMNGNIDSKQKLINYLNEKRKELKFEFYLPSASELFEEAEKVIQFSTGKQTYALEDILSLDLKSMYKLAKKVNPFATSLNSIYEAYYISCISLLFFEEKSFEYNEFVKVALELFEVEIEHGRIVQYRESLSMPKLKGIFIYFTKQEDILEVDENEKYRVINNDKLLALREKYSNDISNQISIKLKVNNE